MTNVGSTESGHGCAVANAARSQQILLIKLLLLLFPDAEPKYLIVVRPAPPPSQKKSCSGIFHSFCFLLTLNHDFLSLFYPRRPEPWEGLRMQIRS